MQLTGHNFTNSDTCHGASFIAEGAPIDMAEIVIDGRYPEEGWARNLESHEMVRVLRGIGRLSVRNGLVTEIEEGDVVHVSPMTWFAWEGDMTILMACSPAFDPEQYELGGDDEI